MTQLYVAPVVTEVLEGEEPVEEVFTQESAEVIAQPATGLIEQPVAEVIALLAAGECEVFEQPVAGGGPNCLRRSCSRRLRDRRPRGLQREGTH